MKENLGRKALAIIVAIIVVTSDLIAYATINPMQDQSKDSPGVPGDLTNQEILDMYKAGLSAEIIIAKIRSTPSKFVTSPAALVELKNANIPEAVILAMVETPPTPAKANLPAKSSDLESAPPKLTKVTIPDGTPIEIELVENVSSEAVEEGGLIDFSVVQPVQINHLTVIERGAAAKGRIVEVKKARHWGRAGKLVWAIQNVNTVDEQRIPLRLTKETQGGGSSGKVAAAVVVTAIFFWPAAPLWGLKKGKPAVIPAGTRATSFVHGEFTVKGKAVEIDQ